MEPRHNISVMKVEMSSTSIEHLCFINKNSTTTIEIRLFSKGVPYLVSSELSVRVLCRKPDGSTVKKNITNFGSDRSCLLLTVDQTLSNIVGTVTMVVELYKVVDDETLAMHSKYLKLNVYE